MTYVVRTLITGDKPLGLFMRRMLLTVLLLAIAAASYAQPRRERRKPPWEIEPTRETKEKVEDLIADIKDPEITIEVDPRKSRLVRTKRPVSRFSMTNPSVCDNV